jgi:hypothetical protein
MWYYGGSFGSRPLMDTYALMSVPICAFLDWISKKMKMVQILFGIIFLLKAYCW